MSHGSYRQTFVWDRRPRRSPPTSHKSTSCQPWERIGLCRGNSRIALLFENKESAANDEKRKIERTILDDIEKRGQTRMGLLKKSLSCMGHGSYRPTFVWDRRPRRSPPGVSVEHNGFNGCYDFAPGGGTASSRGVEIASRSEPPVTGQRRPAPDGAEEYHAAIVGALLMEIMYAVQTCDSCASAGA